VEKRGERLVVEARIKVSATGHKVPTGSADKHLLLVVAARDARVAEEALALIDVRYRELPCIADMDVALAEGAPLVHEKRASDGEFHDPDTLAAARQLGKRHIPLYVIGVGTDAGGPVPDSDGHFIRYQGQTVISRLDRSGLQTLARTGQGAYFDLQDDDGEWRTLLAQLRERTHAATHAASQPLLQGIALYPWLLLPVLPVIITVLAFNFVGDAMQDALNPRKRRS